MDTQQVTLEQMQEAAKKYGVLVYTQAQMFTQDDWKSAKVQQQVVWEVPNILARPEDPGNSYAFQIVRLVRSTAIALMKESPLFNPWELWKQEPYYFCFLDPQRPPFHKEILWYRFYRDIPMDEVIEQFGITNENARQLLKDMFSEIEDGTNALMLDVFEIRRNQKFFHHH